MSTLLLNIGSSSIKYGLYIEGHTDLLGSITGLNTEYSAWVHGEQTLSLPQNVDLACGLTQLLEHIQTIATPQYILHRTVHGGVAFTQPTLVNDAVLAALHDLIPLAPLHLPSSLLGMEMAAAAFPSAQSIAVFDTAFHATLPAHEYTYALPHDLCQQHHIRRFGFHGMSHAYASMKAAQYLGQPHINGVVLHLGSGASMSAIAHGQSQATTMGLTPLGGLIMGTRAGDLDPGVVLYLANQLKQSPKAIENLLNRESGLKGLCGKEDMRDCTQSAQAGHSQAQLALACYTERIRDTLAAYLMKLESPNAIVFTGGVGEHAPLIREKIIQGMDRLGLHLDTDKNRKQRTDSVTAIHSQKSELAILVVEANEAQYMLDATAHLRDQH